MLFRVPVVKSLPKGHYRADYIFGPLGLLDSFRVILKIYRILLKRYVLGKIANAAHYINGHQQTQLKNLVCHFLCFAVTGLSARYP